MRNLEYARVESLAGESAFVQELKKISTVLCKNNACLLLKGERGTGKRLFAFLVHLQGKNNPEDFFEHNCSVYSQEESSRFFELVSQLPSFDFLGKTIFISNADNLSAELQVKLEELLKSIREQRKNIRFIFSTEVNIEDKIEQGLFSQSLYCLMSSVPVNMLPLRQRKDDILPIANYYFAKLSADCGAAAHFNDHISGYHIHVHALWTGGRIFLLGCADLFFNHAAAVFTFGNVRARV